MSVSTVVVPECSHGPFGCFFFGHSKYLGCGDEFVVKSHGVGGGGNCSHYQVHQQEQTVLVRQLYSFGNFEGNFQAISW